MILKHLWTVMSFSSKKCWMMRWQSMWKADMFGNKLQPALFCWKKKIKIVVFAPTWRQEQMQLTLQSDLLQNGLFTRNTDEQDFNTNTRHIWTLNPEQENHHGRGFILNPVGSAFPQPAAIPAGWTYRPAPRSGLYPTSPAPPPATRSLSPSCSGNGRPCTPQLRPPRWENKQ